LTLSTNIKKIPELLPMPAQNAAARAQVVRRFNRFYTKQIGVLRDGLLDSPFSLAEVRVLYELAHRTTPTAAEIAADLGLDTGYLSRILRDFKKRSFVRATPSPNDARQSLLTLTPRGRKAFGALDARSNQEIAAMLRALSAAEQRRLVAALDDVQQLLTAKAASDSAQANGEPVLLRPHRPGDMGWIVHRHGVLYHEEYGWDERFEALVAKVVAEFIEHFDPAREHCWVAERAGEIVGCVFLVQKSRTVAQLRLLLVEPSARGGGLGARLVDECIRFARRRGYRKMTLWTNQVLHAARHIYVKAGFVLASEARHHMFGPELVGQTWELDL
jgi:DNA-binding MarR family transcriptional regulator/GNAT superfamily N-acetyltransferase